MRGSLRKLPSGSWEIRLFLGTDDAGKKRYRSKSVKGSKREAERTMRQLITDVEAGDAEADRSEQLLTVDELLVRWRAANINDWSPTTARDHKRAAEAWISPHIGTVRINRLTVERLERFYRTLLKGGTRAAGLGARCRHNRSRRHTASSGPLWGMLSAGRSSPPTRR
jgi:integrase